jgi:hypothetical protein
MRAAAFKDLDILTSSQECQALMIVCAVACHHLKAYLQPAEYGRAIHEASYCGAFKFLMCLNRVESPVP